MAHLWRWHEPEAQQVAIQMAALMMVRCVPASEVSRAEMQAACAKEQLCEVSLSKFQSGMQESGHGSEVRGQCHVNGVHSWWARAMEAVWTETHHRLRLKEEQLLTAWGLVTEDDDEDSRC